MRSILIAIGLMFFVSGCGLTADGNALRDLLEERGKTAAAESLETAEWYICRAAPVGSIKDRYFTTAEKTMAYYTLCKTLPTFVLPIEPDPPIVQPGGIIKEEVPEDFIS